MVGVGFNGSDYQNYPHMNLTHHRYCIVGQPRCGSHHLEHIIYQQLLQKDPTAIRLGEFLDWWSSGFSKFEIANGVIYKQKTDGENNALKEFDNRTKILKNVNPTQPLVSRLFFIENMLSSFTDQAKMYQDAGFKFIYLERDLESQIISYCFSIEHRQWSHHIFSNYKTLDINRLKSYIFDFTKNNLYGERWLNTVNYEHVNYESLAPYSSEFVKQMPIDPYDLVLNKDEVKTIFKTYLPLLKNQLPLLINF